MSNTGLVVIGIIAVAAGFAAFAMQNKATAAPKGNKPGTRQKLETLAFGSDLVRDQVSEWGKVFDNPGGAPKTSPSNAANGAP